VSQTVTWEVGLSFFGRSSNLAGNFAWLMLWHKHERVSTQRLFPVLALGLSPTAPPRPLALGGLALALELALSWLFCSWLALGSEALGLVWKA
jgi:hypothetical protein